jgi:hypothetical protein
MPDLGARLRRRLMPRSVPWPLVDLFSRATVRTTLWLGRRFPRFRQRHRVAWGLVLLAGGAGLVGAALDQDARRPAEPRVQPRR